MIPNAKIIMWIIGIILLLVLFIGVPVIIWYSTKTTDTSDTPPTTPPATDPVKPPTDPGTSGIFAIQHNSGKCVHPLGGSSNPNDDTKAVLYTGCTEPQTQFQFTTQGSLQHVKSKKCLHPYGGSANPDNDTGLVFYTGCDEPRLKFEFANDGSLKHTASKKCIHPFKGSENPSNDTPLVFYNSCVADSDGGPRLKFKKLPI